MTCVMLVFLSLVEYSIILWDGVKRRTEKQLRLEVSLIIFMIFLTSLLQACLEQSDSNCNNNGPVYHNYPNIAKKKHFITKIDNSVNVIQVEQILKYKT